MNNKGFTLVEIMCVLVILGIILAIGVPTIINLNESAEEVGINMAMIDLNGREMKCWTEIKLGSNWDEDKKVFDSCSYDMPNYQWITLNPGSGQIKFKETTISLNRKLSTASRPAEWIMQK